MLKRLHVKGFKSLADLEVEFPRLTVLFGPNASGKSNILEAAQLLSRCATSRTLFDAFDESIRGHPLEAFSFEPDGLTGHLRRASVELELEATVQAHGDHYGYRVRIGVQPGSGSLSVLDENLVKLKKDGTPRDRPRIELVDDRLHVRRVGGAGHPYQEEVGLHHTRLSDPRFSGRGYEPIERCRDEFEAWRVYYLDPRVGMRTPRPPADVRDIGTLGEDIAPYLYRLRAEHPKPYDAVRRTLRNIVPSVNDVTVDLDDKRGTLDILVTQDGCSYSSRVVSEGTLRVLALCAIAVNPWSRGLVAFEEPENGVHPRRLELIAQMLVSLALSQDRQVVVTTHSPLFCASIMRLTQDQTDAARLYAVRRDAHGTQVRPLTEQADSLFAGTEVAEGLSSPTEDGLLQEVLVRGWLDE